MNANQQIFRSLQLIARELRNSGQLAEPLLAAGMILLAAELLDDQAEDIGRMQPIGDDDGEPAELPHGAPAARPRHPVDRHIERAKRPETVTIGRTPSPRFDGPCAGGGRHKAAADGDRACLKCGKLPKGAAPADEPGVDKRTLPLPSGRVHYLTAARSQTPCNLAAADVPKKERTAELATPPITCGPCVAQLRHDGAL